MQAKPKVFDKFVLVSWLNDGSKDIVFVQNTETNEVQKITSDPNSDNFRLVAIHKAADPKKAEVVLSNGTEEGTVKFRLEIAATAPHRSCSAGAPTDGAQDVQNPVPGGTAPAIMSRQAQCTQNAQQAARFGANQQGVTQTQPGPARCCRREPLKCAANELRRLRSWSNQSASRRLLRMFPVNPRHSNLISCVFALFLCCRSVLSYISRWRRRSRQWIHRRPRSATIR